MHRREIIVTLTVEHADGPYREDDWEQNVPAAVRGAVDNIPVLWVGADADAEYQIVKVDVSDTEEEWIDLNLEAARHGVFIPTRTTEG